MERNVNAITDREQQMFSLLYMNLRTAIVFALLFSSTESANEFGFACFASPEDFNSIEIN